MLIFRAIPLYILLYNGHFSMTKWLCLELMHSFLRDAEKDFPSRDNNHIIATFITNSLDGLPKAEFQKIQGEHKRILEYVVLVD